MTMIVSLKHLVRISLFSSSAGERGQTVGPILAPKGRQILASLGPLGRKAVSELPARGRLTRTKR